MTLVPLFITVFAVLMLAGYAARRRRLKFSSRLTVGIIAGMSALRCR